jgi:hypothetical protein
MYLLLLAFTAIFISACLLTRLFFRNRGSALVLLVFLLLYLLPTLAGALGLLRPYFLLILALAVLGGSLLAYLLKGRSYARPGGGNFLPLVYQARPLSLEVLLVVVPLLGALFWMAVFVVKSLRHQIAGHYIPPYFWDVVEYHFPILVHAVQTGTLWTTFWAHYPMGCEMIHAWGFVFLRNDALVYPVHFLFTLVLIFFSGLIIHTLGFADRRKFSGAAILAYLMLAVMLLLSPPLWDMQFNQVGKNDIALSAFIMAALYFLLQYKTEAAAGNSLGENIWLLGLTLGLISGIKANGVFYSVFFLGLLVKDVFSRKISWYWVGVVCACLALLAGFWYIRPLIMLGNFPPSGVKQSIIANLNQAPALFLTGRENRLFTLSMVFCVLMGVIWRRKDYLMRVANYTLAASIVIFWLTPYSAWNGDMQLRLAPATIPLVIILAVATFLLLIVKVRAAGPARPRPAANFWSYGRVTLLAVVLLVLGAAALAGISFLGVLAAKPRWAWNFRGLIVIGCLAAAVYLYNAVPARRDYQFNLSRGLVSAGAYLVVFVALALQMATFKPPGDLPGYNENTAVYRWVYQHLHGRTIGLFGLRPYGLYGRELSNRVIYGGDSHGTNLKDWLGLLRKQKVDYLVLGRDYAQHEGWYDYRPFPADLAKIKASPRLFKPVWSDQRAVIFKVEPGFYAGGGGPGKLP